MRENSIASIRNDEAAHVCVENDFDADDSGAQVHVIPPSDAELEVEVESIFQPGGLDQ